MFELRSKLRIRTFDNRNNFKMCVQKYIPPRQTAPIIFIIFPIIPEIAPVVIIVIIIIPQIQIFIVISYFFSALTISEIFEDYIQNKKIKNVANKMLNIFAIMIPLLTIIGVFNLS